MSIELINDWRAWVMVSASLVGLALFAYTAWRVYLSRHPKRRSDELLGFSHTALLIVAGAGWLLLSIAYSAAEQLFAFPWQGVRLVVASVAVAWIGYALIIGVNEVRKGRK